MFDELFHSIMEQWSNFAVTFFAGAGAPKVLGFLIPIIPACYGVFIKWRTSGYRLVDRLEEFTNSQDERLQKSRAQLSALVEFPLPDRLTDRPIFAPRALSKALRGMNWGFGIAATNNLAEAARLSADRARFSEILGKEHQQREALAHLLLGAKAASRQSGDPRERNAARSEALDQFDKALAIDSNDADALEYSGMMLLELNEPAMALQRFENLIECRKSVGGVNLARAYRLKAMANEQQVPPKNTLAYEALTRAIQELPPGCTLDHALTYEHLAMAAQKLSYSAKHLQHLRKAWTFYHTLRNSIEGKNGLDRVSAKLAKLDDPDQLSMAMEKVLPESRVGFFSKLTEPSG
jgi:tetratricopeptide (TPR) repeat protein